MSILVQTPSDAGWVSVSVARQIYSAVMSIPGPDRLAKRRQHAATVIAVVMTLWFVAVPALAVAAFFTGFTLPGADPPADEQRARTGTLILALAVVLVLPPAAATVVGVRNRRPIAASFCGLITAVGLAAGLFLVPSGLDEFGPRSTPVVTHPQPPGHCVERSGGDTRCPGG